jgi:hypothetical protein
VAAPGAGEGGDSGVLGCRESYQLARGSCWTESLCETLVFPQQTPPVGVRSWSLAAPQCAPDERQHCLGFRALSDISVFFCTGESRATSVFFCPPTCCALSMRRPWSLCARAREASLEPLREHQASLQPLREREQSLCAFSANEAHGHALVDARKRRHTHSLGCRMVSVAATDAANGGIRMVSVRDVWTERTGGVQARPRA